ncbi:trypsin-like protease-like protein 1 [Lojkania enalia]|uniref:Trypsin-like protease-like protein 1 n=1 Tax=Lojkania enalia TaxID=147567 RepID=A0A9P4ND79_9PLEO|nr:trypsin-like protease-like protein 1 [Didymosphaeria enalia]
MGLKAFLLALAIPALSTAAALPQDVTTQIVGGVAAQQGDFPFIVSLQRNGAHFCGGSLLNSRTVITAAHCAVGQSPSSLRVRAGSLSRTSGGTLVGVSSIVVHPSFSSSTLDSDVAIFKLSTAIPTSGTIGYATLPPSGSDPAANSITTVAGWGTLSQGGSSLPTNLQKVDVPVISRSTCRSQYGTSAITNNMFCAGYTSGGKDSCQGDSGGPIVDTSKVLIGLVSWGEGCAQPNRAGVYTRVATLLSFITANM